MKWEDNNNRKAKAVQWNNGDAISNDDCELILIKEFLGDRDEIWIVQIKDGKEIARHNIKFIESISWE